MKDNLRIYGVRDSYIKYLSQYQEHLFLHKDGLSGRKYIGVVLEINKFSYFAPLSSFKPKHEKMKESVDFIKIKDYAVININNMIPVPKEQLVELNINVEKDPHYKFLLQAEMRFRSKCLTFVKQHSNLDDWEYHELYASAESIKTDFQIIFLAGNTLTNGSMDVKSHNLLLSLTMLYYHNC